MLTWSIISFSSASGTGAAWGLTVHEANKFIDSILHNMVLHWLLIVPDT